MQSFARFKILTKLVTENAATVLFLCDNLLVEYKLFEHLFCLFSLLVGFFSWCYIRAENNARYLRIWSNLLIYSCRICLLQVV